MYRAFAFAILFLAAAGLASAAEAPAAAPRSSSEQKAPAHSPAKSLAAAAAAPGHTPAKSPAAGPAHAPANAPSSTASAPSIASAPTIASSPESSPAVAPSSNTDEFDEDILYATEAAILGSPPAPSVSNAPAEDDLSSTTSATGRARSQIGTVVTFGALATAIVAVFA